MRVVLADAGPLIGLARIQRLQLLRDLFTTLWITEVIAAEARRQGVFLIGTAAFWCWPRSVAW